MKPEDVIWPWRMEAFPHDKTTLALIRDKLYDRGYDFKRLAEKPPTVGVEAAEKLIVKLDQLRKDGEVPWVLLWGPDSAALQAIARLIPLGMALVKKMSCEIVRNSNLTDLFFQKEPDDMWEDDPAGESLESITTTGTLVWLDVAEVVSGAKHQTGKFTDILHYRLWHKMHTVFTMVVDNPERFDAVTKMLDKAIGLTGAHEVLTQAVRVHVKGKVREAPKMTVVV